MPDPAARLPSSLREHAWWTRLTDRKIPALMVHPAWETGQRVPVVLWMHGRTVDKELDPGRYLRWMRAGIGTCAVDLPGHGERFDDSLQQPERTFDVVTRMMDEIDGIVAALEKLDGFDRSRIAIGGMSAGGMATLARLTRPHSFTSATVEATTGSWTHQSDRKMFQNVSQNRIDSLDPIRNLATWQEIPLQAIHCEADEWVKFPGQKAFIDALRAQYNNQDRIEFVTYERTGAPHEHAGFGRKSGDAKNKQTMFLSRWLLASGQK